jgi:hypothetical protein
VRTVAIALTLIAGCAAGPSEPDAARASDAASAIDAHASDAPALDAADPLASLPTCTTGVIASLSLDVIQPLARDTDSYRPPPSAMPDGVAAAVTALAASRVDEARAAAEAVGYVLCRGVGDEASLVLVRPAADATGHAFLAIRTNASARALVLEAPHPIFDADSDAEAVAIFQATRARAVMIAGTHRCASARASGCSGTADACGVGEPVRESDMAHAVDSVYQAAHLALASAYADAWFVGVHGFAGPGASVSNGTSDPVPATSRSARLALALHARFGDEVTTCNDFGDATITRDVRVCGTWDVQARALQGSVDACTMEGPAATDRFVHVEQAPAYRPGRASDVAAAILEVL